MTCLHSCLQARQYLPAALTPDRGFLAGIALTPTLLDVTLCAPACRFGNTCLLHLEDMSFENLGRLFARYRGTFPCFSDDVQARMQALTQPSPH